MREENIKQVNVNDFIGILKYVYIVVARSESLRLI